MPSCSIAFPHSVLLISEPGSGQIPARLGPLNVAATESCIAVGCRSELDGKTHVVIGRDEGIRLDEAPIFSGKISVKGEKIAVQTVFNQNLIEIPVSSGDVYMKIWVNDPREPDRITIAIEG